MKRFWSRRRSWEAAIAFAIAMSALTLWTNTIPMTASDQDRVGHIHSQDEATYSRVALEMLATGDWLTPKLQERLFLYKPPLLYWLSAASAGALGPSRLSLRLPSLLAGALACALLFVWCSETAGMLVGAIAGLLMLANSAWQTMSRINTMDALLSFWILLALYLLARDPRLERRASVVGFGAATAAAIMTKSVAGLVPLIVLALFCAVTKSESHPGTLRVIQAGLVALALAAPWHLYQLAVHPQWFWTEYFRAQLFGFGVKPPAESSSEPHLWFYAKRLFLTDPVLVVLFLLALPRLVISAVRRNIDAILFGLWLVTLLLSLTAFQARSFLYVVPLVAPLCLVAILYSPFPRRTQPVLLAALLAASAVKMASGAPWGLAYYRIATPAAQPILKNYAAAHRPNELVLIQTDDEFYSLLLPLTWVRYCYIDTTHAAERYAPHLADLGITLPITSFEGASKVYESKIRAWGVSDTDMLGTALIAQNDAEVIAFINANPDRDFYAPRSLVDAAPTHFEASHQVQYVSAGRALLLGRAAPAKTHPRLLVDWAFH